MGLCKCPRRRVTPLFCFEHRVNVCESCMLSSHPKCVVQSYLRWLQDSDYEPSCPLCHKALAGGDTVRLVCYDVVHWRCLCIRCRSLPPLTAPAGFRCPTCAAPLFPPPDTRGPVADALRSRLAAVSWARPGLGLPLLEDADPDPDPSDGSEWGGESSAPPAAPDPPPSPPPPPPSHAVIHVGGGQSLHGSAPRKPLWGRENRSEAERGEEDEKYRRRPHKAGLRHRLRCRPRAPPLALLLLALPLLGLLLLLGRLGGGDLSPPPPLGAEPLRPGR